MDRQIVYNGQVPLETDLLNTNKNTMVGLSKLSAALLGTGIVLNGFTCIPTGVASLQVQLTAGEIYSLQNIDGTAYSSIAFDMSHQIVKQGILLDTVLLTATPPVTGGQSINYLVQVTYTDSDTGAVVLPYYNASNPSVAYSGPANSGTTNNTVRKGLATVNIKAGVAATTGSQTTPAPDSGYTGMFVVTVANGQTTITGTSISTLAGAPFVVETLNQKVGQASSQITATATGTSDALVGTYSPVITTLVNGITLMVRAILANTSATPTFQANSTAVKTIVKGNNLPLVAGDIAGAGHWIELQYDLTLDKWVLLNPATGVTAIISPASIQGAFKNLQLSATGLSANISVTADEISVENASNAYQTLRAVNLTIAGTAGIGAPNGLDTGVSLAINTWYSLWIIWNGTTTSGLFSLSATAPTLPAGYTHKARVGWMRTDASGNKFPLAFTQKNRDVELAPAATTNVTDFPTMASGSNASVKTAVATANFVPPTASKIHVLSGATSGQNAAVYLSPNAGAGMSEHIYFITTIVGVALYFKVTMILVTSNIYWLSGNTTGSLKAVGWEDNI